MSIHLEKTVLLRIASYLFFAFMCANLLFLDIWLYRMNAIVQEEPSTVAQKVDVPQTEKAESIQGNGGCDEECLSKVYERINEATGSLKLSLQPKASQEISVSSGVKEFYVSFGSGSNTTDEWADVLGVEASIDSTKYGRIRSLSFEATIHIPTGNEIAYVRLYNVTDDHPVWFSEVSVEGGTAKLVTSPPITLDSGNKRYRVQMKTSLKYQANLTQARLRITTY